jgi:hypothetical protein
MKVGDGNVEEAKSAANLLAETIHRRSRPIMLNGKPAAKIARQTRLATLAILMAMLLAILHW